MKLEMNPQFKYYAIAIFCLIACFAKAQSVELSGYIESSDSTPIEKATIKINNRVQISDTNGFYVFKDILEKRVAIEISCVGFITQKQSFNLKSGTNSLNIVLKKDEHVIKDIHVKGLSKVNEVNRQAYNVTSIDAKKLHNTTLDLAHALDKVSGVRFRESGGVGSNFNLSLNGFSGKQVKFYLDGMPMENFGSAFQINNIPINIAERVEVYKGVVPISLGGDALGGAINIITNPNHGNYLDVSYSYGSFNTHRTTINAGYTTDKGLTFQVNAFQNYSDNNYNVLVDILEDFDTGVTRNGWAKRFHDTYSNQTVIAQVGVVDKPYADRLTIGTTVGRVHADIQTGNRMFDVYGKRFRDGDILIPSLKYVKNNLFVEGLSLHLQGNINLGQERTVDTAFMQYSWSGEGRYKTADQTWAPGGERSRQLYKYRNNNSAINAHLNYALNDRHKIVLNGVYNGFNRKGENVILPEDENAKQPQIVNKTVVGLGYQYIRQDHWEATAFVKQYFQDNSSSYVIDWTSYPQHSKFNGTGYGLAASWFISPHVQLKSSYEKSYRLPEGEELFGDVVNISPNTTLEPEKSDNVNVGLTYHTFLNEDHYLEFIGNYIYRDAEGFIRPVISTVGTAEFRYANLRDVRNNGLETEFRYTFKRLLHIGANATYQNLRNKTMYETGSTTPSPVYNDRIPNMPYLFGNLNSSISFSDLFQNKDTFSLQYNMLYVNTFYLRWPSQGETKDGIIPTQLAHDASVMYTMCDGKYNIVLEGRNLADRLLFDNFSLQKPGRSFNIKFRYFFKQ